MEFESHHQTLHQTPNGSRKASFIENLTCASRKSSNGSIKPLKEEVLYLSKSYQLSEFTFEDEFGKEKSAEIIRKRYVVDPSGCNKTSPHGILSIAILRRHILCDCLILVKQYRPTLKSYVLEFPAKIIDITEDERTGAVHDVENNTGFRSTVIKHISPETAMDPELCDTKLKLVSMIIDGDDPIKNNLFGNSPLNKSRSNSTTSYTSHHHQQQQQQQHGTSLEQSSLEHHNSQHPINHKRRGNSHHEYLHPEDTLSNVQQNNNNNNSNGNSNNNNNNNGHSSEDEEPDDIEVIPVPINGLLDRLNEYSKRNIVIDSRVYSFAIGLKQGEKLAQNTTNPENIEIAI